jgi:hypothetical protein
MTLLAAYAIAVGAFALFLVLLVVFTLHEVTR